MDSLTEFNRCYYSKPIDYDSFPVMKNFREEALDLDVMQQCNGLQNCKASIKHSYLGLINAARNFD